jgi:Zn-dependent protease
VGNFTGFGLRVALYMLASLLVGMSVREYARAAAAVRLGDPTPRLWGRLSWHPRAWFDPFGSGFLAALIAILWAAGAYWLPAAYAKPAPVDPRSLRHGPRDIVIVSLAGPVSSVVLGILGGFVVRLTTLPVETRLAALVFTFTCMSLAVFHMLPIPGLDGARLVGLLLPPAAAETYRNADKYLPLIVLVVLFLFGTGSLSILSTLSRALCDAAAGAGCGGFR